MTSELTVPGAATADASPLEYFCFKLGTQNYGVPADSVCHVSQLAPFAPAPDLAPSLAGFFWLYGKRIPVVDLRVEFGFADLRTGSETRVICVSLVSTSGGMVVLGMIVDEVGSVFRIQAGAIEPAPNYSRQVETDYIQGLAKTSRGTIVLLGLARIFSEKTLAAVASAQDRYFQ